LGDRGAKVLSRAVRLYYSTGMSSIRRRPANVRPATRSRSARRYTALRQDFTALFENASDIILINDREGNVVAANRAAREFGGYSLEEFERGVHLRKILAPDDYEAAMLLTARALDGLPVPEMYEREAVLHDGSHRVVELRSNVLHTAGQPPLLQTIGRDVTEQKEAVAFQNALLQVSQALLTTRSVDELGRVICEAAGRVLQVDGAYLWLRRGQQLVACAAAGRVATEFIGLRRPIDASLVGQIYRAADVLVVNDFQHSLYNIDPARAFGVQAMLAVPLRRSEPSVGVLVFTDTVNPRRFTATLRDRAVIFGAQTTVAIEAALARQGEEEEGQISAALLEVTRTIRESLDEQDVLREVARGARQSTAADWAAVALFDAASGVLQVHATDGWPSDYAAELCLVDFSPAVDDEFGPLLRHDTIEVREPPRERLYGRWSVSSLLGAPMVRGGNLIGAVTIGYWQRRGAFSARERRLTEGIAAQAAVAVHNARLVEDLRGANQLKSEFLGTMSHELRTPLNAMLGYTELLREEAMGPITADQREAFERMLLNGRGLLELINMTLDVNRLEAGRLTMRASEFRLEELFEELQTEFGVRVPNGVQLSWAAPPDDSALFTDRGKLKVIVRNLVDNALKFTPHGTIAVGAQRNPEAERMMITVRDSGIGIPEAAQPSIFEMFRQLDQPGATTRGGVGLGLYVVQRYAELLGGGVTVESSPGVGSTFSVDVSLRLTA